MQQLIKPRAGFHLNLCRENILCLGYFHFHSASLLMLDMLFKWHHTVFMSEYSSDVEAVTCQLTSWQMYLYSCASDMKYITIAYLCRFHVRVIWVFIHVIDSLLWKTNLKQGIGSQFNYLTDFFTKTTRFALFRISDKAAAQGQRTCCYHQEPQALPNLTRIELCEANDSAAQSKASDVNVRMVWKMPTRPTSR